MSNQSYSVLTQAVGLFTLSQGSRSSFQSAGADPPLLKCNWSAEEVVGLWTLKMVDPLSTQYFLIQLQVGINHFFLNSLTNEKGVSNKKIVTMHSSITIFAYFIYFKSLSDLSLRLFWDLSEISRGGGGVGILNLGSEMR